MVRKIISSVIAAVTVCIACADDKSGETMKSEKKYEFKDFEFLNIVPCPPGEEAERAAEAAEVHRRIGIDRFLYSLTLHPEGYPAMNKAEALIESYRKFAKAMEKHNLHAGVLIQSIIGHWARTDKDEEKWIRSVGIDGNTKRFCVLDPEYRSYIRTVVTLLAKEKPCFILTDDDIRSFFPVLECFCPLHTAEFNRRTGKNLTPDEYRNLIFNTKPQDKDLQTFEKLRGDTLCGLFDLIRSAIDAVDPSIPAGICANEVLERSFVSEYARRLAGGANEPLMRIGNNLYKEVAPMDLPVNFIKTHATRLYFNDVPKILDEADTFPHSLYSRSAVGMHAKLTSSIFAGLNGAKLWYVGMSRDGVKNPEHYVDILEKNSGFYQTLAGEVKGTVPRGLAIPAFRSFPRWQPAQIIDWAGLEHFSMNKGLPQRFPGKFGIPMQAAMGSAVKDAVMITSGEELYRFSDDELKKLLSGKLLLMGDASVEFTRRGMSRYLGCHAELKPMLFNRERFLPDDVRCPVAIRGDMPFISLTDKKAKVISMLRYAASETAEMEDVAPGMVIYHNELGGTVCTVARSLDSSNFTYRDHGKLYALRMLKEIYGEDTPYIVENFQTCMAVQRDTASGESLLGIFNLNFDPMENTVLNCRKVPQKLQYLDGDGTWKKIDFKVLDNNRIVVEKTLHCYGCLVLKVTP